jgi:hypothetical protein
VLPVFLHGTNACVGDDARNPCARQQPCADMKPRCAWVAHTIRMFSTARLLQAGPGRIAQLSPGWLHSPNQSAVGGSAMRRRMRAAVL